MPNSLGDLNRGDLVVAVFGRDHGKPRPGVVVQSDYFRKHTSYVVCPLSSELIEKDLFRIPLLKNDTPGLQKNSEVMIDKIAVVERVRIRQRIGHLSRAQMAIIDVALARWLGLSREPSRSTKPN